MGGGGKLFGARRQMKNVRVASPKLDCYSRVFAKMTVCTGYFAKILVKYWGLTKCTTGRILRV